MIEIRNRFTGDTLHIVDTEYLHNADLHDTDLRNAYLCDVNLRGADLRGSDLRGSDLRDADLRGADLRDAHLYGANLRNADLRGAILCGADLRGADLCGADLRGADLCHKKIKSLYVFTGLYEHTIWIVLFDDDSRWLRMGCLFKSLDEWSKITIEKSNLSEYPDDGSTKSLRRKRAYYYALAELTTLQ